MTRSEKDGIRRRTKLRHFLLRLRAGCIEVRDDYRKALFLAVYLIIISSLFFFRDAIFGFEQYGAFSKMVEWFACLAVFPNLVVFPVLFLVLMGTPYGTVSSRQDLLKIGFTNHAGEAPVLVTGILKKDNHNIAVFQFDHCGIPLSVWEDRRAEIETALGLVIAKLAWGKGRRTILVYAAPAESDLPERITWKNKYLSQDSFVLVLGKSLLGLVTINLAHIPHILLGGSTDSGKSVLLKLLLMQAIRKGATVCIADFKGGVDFPAVWHERCRMIFDEGDLLELLTDLVEELERRKALFQSTGHPNIDKYNKATGKNMERYLFACDEVAEMLDKTGLDKAQKGLVSEIENKLSTIARQGRAFGIHLILATQRPDANILPGQIKSNIDTRVCGRADSILSQIILDNTSAADLIPKDSKGRFILQDGTIFQGFLFDEDDPTVWKGGALPC